MPPQVLERPSAGDYGEYYNNYINLVPAGDLVDILKTQVAALHALLEHVSEAQAGSSYAPGKWTLREVVGHLTDTERVFAFRATAFSRGDAQPLPSFDQVAWNPLGEYDNRALGDLLAEWTHVRAASIALVEGMPGAGLQRRGIASGLEITALACLCILAGHVNYHIEHVREHYIS